MTAQAVRPLPRRIRLRPLGGRRHPRVKRDARLLSVAGIVGARVHAGGRLVGLVDDLVVRVGEETYPPVVGAVVRSARGRTYVTGESIVEILPGELVLAGPLERDPVERRPGLVALAHDVLDRQIVDIDGADIDRVSDLVLGRHDDGFRLVGVDVSMRTLVRRVGPRSLRRRVAAKRVYDWSSVAAFSERPGAEAASVLHLTAAAAALRERGPADLERLLADLPPHERKQFVGRGQGTA